MANRGPLRDPLLCATPLDPRLRANLGVIPAEAGIQCFPTPLDPRLRGDDAAVVPAEAGTQVQLPARALHHTGSRASRYALARDDT